MHPSHPLVVLIVASLAMLVPTACRAEPKEDFSIPLDSKPLNREDPQYLTSYAPVLRNAKEAVVAVHTANVVRVIRSQGYDPREEMLRRFFGLPSPRRQEEATVEERRLPQGMGSGVVISPDGYILTNNHVIATERGGAADEVLVRLNDDRELEATIVGRDPGSDLAMLKVDAADLPHIPVADSDQLEVGDIVFAIGNPMGVGLTITQGIVSATGRSHLSILGETGYESFIQTDAPINPGNSGGALVDAYGRLVGINTAILSRSGGSIGIGFAIPSAFARSVATALVRDGEVRRGILGVSIDEMTEAYAEAFQAPEGKGVLVQSVVKDLPADKAGIRKGDVILSINGEEVEDARDLRLKVSESAPGEEVDIVLYRMGKRMKLKAQLADPENPYGSGRLVGELIDGVQAAIIDDDMRMRLALDRRVEGLVILSVDNDSKYRDILAAGAVIATINGQQPESVDEASELLLSQKISYLYIYFKGRGRYMSLTVD